MDEGDKKKKSLVLLIGVIIFSLGLYFIMGVFSEKGQIVQVSVNGQVIKELPLSVDTEFIAKGYEGGENKIVVKHSKCYVVYADCPDKLCVKQGEISKNGESVICLPHRVVITVIKHAKEKTIDTIAK